MSMELKIGKHLIGEKHPTYFIADIAANHDGDLDRAIKLCELRPRLARTRPSSRTSEVRKLFRIMASAT